MTGGEGNQLISVQPNDLKFICKFHLIYVVIACMHVNSYVCMYVYMHENVYVESIWMYVKVHDSILWLCHELGKRKNMDAKNWCCVEFQVVIGRDALEMIIYDKFMELDLWRIY